MKNDYLGCARKRRTDHLVFILLHEILPNSKLKIARVLRSLDNRTAGNAEKIQRAKYDALQFDVAESFVQREQVPVGDDHFSRANSVRSFTNENHRYIILTHLIHW